MLMSSGEWFNKHILVIYTDTKRKKAGYLIFFLFRQSRKLILEERKKTKGISGCDCHSSRVWSNQV